ncbi:MAG: Cif family virulence factor, partial [Planctomycetota bacterium]
DWDRFLALFMPEARFVRAGGAGAAPIVLTPEQFVAANRRYFERGGYFERSVHEHVDAFGAIAHVFSAYESRRSAEDEKPYSRGINSFQVIASGDRWWIVAITWDYERADGPDIPPEFLPPGAAEGP